MNILILGKESDAHKHTKQVCKKINMYSFITDRTVNLLPEDPHGGR